MRMTASRVKSNDILSPGLCISLLFQSLSKLGQQTEFGTAHRGTRFTAVKATAKPRVRLAHPLLPSFARTTSATFIYLHDICQT
jgi:hypothetical protein